MLVDLHFMFEAVDDAMEQIMFLYQFLEDVFAGVPEES